MFQIVFQALFGCSHHNTTFPLTPGQRNAGKAVSGGARNDTYVVCLDCGQEFAYDWKNMRIGAPVHHHAPRELVAVPLTERMPEPVRTVEA